MEGQGPPAWTTTINSDREDDLLLADEDGRPNAIDENRGPEPFTGNSGLDICRLQTRNNTIRIGTWNARTLYQKGKLANIIQEIKQMRISILGISEVRWLGTGQFSKNGYTMVYSGNNEKHTNGVGIIMTHEIAKSMMGFWPISDREMLMKLDASLSRSQ